MTQIVPLQQQPSAPCDPQTSLVILSPNDPQGKMVLKGVFGHFVSKDEQSNEVEVRLDEQLVDCSAIFSSYSGGATFKVNADEVIIVHSSNSAAIESLKATLAASLAQNWGRRYESLMGHGSVNGLMRQALEAEMTTALNGAQALINSKNVSTSSIPISAFTIASEEVGNLSEIVLLKEPFSTTISSESEVTTDPDFLDLPEQQEQLLFRHDGQLNILLSQGVSVEEFTALLAQSDEAISLALAHLSADFNAEPELMPAQDVIQMLEQKAASRVSEEFTQALNEYASIDPNQYEHTNHTSI